MFLQQQFPEDLFLPVVSLCCDFYRVFSAETNSLRGAEEKLVVLHRQPRLGPFKMNRRMQWTVNTILMKSNISQRYDDSSAVMIHQRN